MVQAFWGFILSAQAVTRGSAPLAPALAGLRILQSRKSYSKLESQFQTAPSGFDTSGTSSVRSSCRDMIEVRAHA